MASFFLYKKDSCCKLENVREVYRKKGFGEPAEFALGPYALLLYKKQLVNVENYLNSENAFFCCIGTMVYKANGYRQSMQALLQDMANGSVDFDRLIGNFCALYYRYEDGTLTFLTDRQNVQHLFTDAEESFLTSSYLAAMEAIPGTLTINRKTCLEKLLLGYSIGAQTLFKEIIHLSNQGKLSTGWRFLQYPPKRIPESDGRCRKANAEKRADKICTYLREIDALRKEFKPEIGLSDGFDSRTLYAATLKTWNEAIAVHTHQTEGVASHQVEGQTVRSITEATGSVLTVVPTKRLCDYSEEEIDAILLDDLYFFDGRCAKDMGAFSPVYTRKYKIATAKDNKLTLNGLGGEVYRRYYLDLKPVFSVKQWMKVHVYPEGVDRIVDKKMFETLHRDLCEKASGELGFSWERMTTGFRARRYYSEIVMPDCDALNCNAHNQMLFYLTPFIEWDMIHDAYRSRNALGACGELEAQIMTCLDERVASFKSHYGYAFNEKPPRGTYVRRLVRGMMPNAFEVRRVGSIVRNKRSETEYYDSVRSKSALLAAATEHLEALFPEIRFSELRRDYTMMPNSAYMGILFYVYKDKIEHDKREDHE